MVQARVPKVDRVRVCEGRAVRRVVFSWIRGGLPPVLRQCHGLRKCDGRLDGLERHESVQRSSCAIAATEGVNLNSTGDVAPRRFSVVGAGFAGVAVAYHLLALATAPVHVKLYDIRGLGAGASGASAGILHPYSAKGKIMWKGEEAMASAERLVSVAQRAIESERIFWQHGLLRLAENTKQALEFHHLQLVPEGPTLPYPLVISGRTAEVLLPGLVADKLKNGSENDMESSPLECKGLWIPKGIVIHPLRYLSALWAACQELARLKGSTAVLESKEVFCLEELEAKEGPFDAVIVAAGAAIGAVRELDGLLPMRLCQGCTVEFSPSSSSAGVVYPEGGPSLLGKTYIAAHGQHNLVAGATNNFGWTERAALEELGKGLLSVQEYQHDVIKIVESSRGLWAPLRKWDVLGVRSGVRALPPKTHQGALPLAGKVEGGPRQRSWWVIAGLGARGILYHAWLAEAVADAAISGTESSIHPALRRWKI